MKKRFLSVVLACSLTAVSLAGCGGGGSKETQPAAAPTTAAEAGEKETAAPEAKPEASGDLSEVEKIKSCIRKPLKCPMEKPSTA